MSLYGRSQLSLLTPYSKVLMLPGVVIFVVVAVVLFMPQANGWFAGKGDAAPAT